MIAALAEDMAAPSLDTPPPAAPEETDDEMPMAIAAAAHSDADESDLADNNEDDVTAIETAPSPEAQPVDDDISKQLDDVRQAVEAASATMSGTEDSDDQEHAPKDDSEAILEDEAICLPDEVAAAHDHEAHDQETHGEETPLVAGPKLAAFIGETVRDVLEDELPSLVRGLVDEALSERHGRYGGSAPIGLRTKSTRH